jgi:hypothetical protein
METIQDLKNSAYIWRVNIPETAAIEANKVDFE